MSKPNDEVIDDYYASHSTPTDAKKSDDDSAKKGLKLKIKAKAPAGTSEEPKPTVPVSGALLVERPKPKIVVRPSIAPKITVKPREEEKIKPMPRSVIFDHK